MEKLNDYLQTLLSTYSYELHLEPNRNPYLISSDGTTDLSGTPLLGTQISMMIFPLIPPTVKQQLPDQAEVQFVHPHKLGKFSFNVKKSPSGFKVTVTPMLNDVSQQPTAAEEETSHSIFSANLKAKTPLSNAASGNSASATFLSEPAPLFSPPVKPSEFAFESASAAYENTVNTAAPTELSPELIFEPTNSSPLSNEDNGQPVIELVSVNDPQFITTFSDSSTYEPPGRRDEFAPVNKFSANNFAPKAENSEDFVQLPVDNFQATQFTETYTNQKQHFEQSATFNNAPPVFSQPAETAAENSSAAFAAGKNNPQARAKMDELFYKMSEAGASDLHMSVTMPPMIRKDGKIMKLECGEGILSPERMHELLTSIMPAKNQEEFARRRDSDFAYEIPGLARFRANIFADRKGIGGVFRIIPTKILTAEQLGLSKAIMDLCNLSKGLVVVTGPTGSGKSTTLCAMVDSINKNREDHIITIEDPIEFTHENQKCLVNQREVHNHTDSFKDALRAALREDPDILLVGEMRDLETISIAIETAETGHLVFGTLHTTTAASTVDRIIDQFPADRQQQIRVMLSESLKGVIAQTLLPKIGGGRVAALEILIVTPAISNLIREGKTFQIASSMQTGKQHGMVMLNDALFELVKKGLVTPRDAYIKAVDKLNFESVLTKNGFKI